MTEFDGGLLMSMTGASLAISGISSNTRDASVAQYGGGVAPEQTPAPAPGWRCRPGGAEQHAQRAQRRRHDAVERRAAGPPGRGRPHTNQLPFTGFAAIPVLLAGVALLGGGLVVRRRTRAQN